MGSLFAGIGGFDLGFERAGFEIAWHSEIDRAASAILASRWPNVLNLGDVTKIDGAAIPPVDVICGGFPCQDLSVAGKRRGFEGERSVLAFEFLRIVREMREATDGRSPAFIVLENVPGLFSSRGGRDFGALLDALGELGPMDIAWRVLDSRYFGVAQRRRRVFVVVDFGGERADEVLALTEGLRGDSPARAAAREDVAGTLGGGSAERGWCDDLDRAGAFVTDDVAFPILSREGKGPASSVDSGNLVVVADPLCANEQRTYTHEGKGNFRLRNVIPFDTTQVSSLANYSAPSPGDPCKPLAAGAHAPAVAIQGATGGARGQNGAGIGGDLAYSLDTTGAQGVSYGIRNDASRDGLARSDSPDAEGRLRKRDAGFNVYEEEAPTLDATAPHGVGLASGVRRLTPRECERLKGFPDDWTAIPGMADGPRYKCLGNAVTVNVAEWIGRRLAEVSQ